jgi:hypothetical protein
VGAADGEPMPRMMFGEVWWSEQEKLSENSVCKCKSRTQGAPGGVRNLDYDVVPREPELTVGGVHGSHGVVQAEAGVAWRAKKKTAGRAAVAAGRKNDTWGRRGAGGGAELQRRRVAVKRGSGRR